MVVFWSASVFLMTLVSFFWDYATVYVVEEKLTTFIFIYTHIHVKLKNPQNISENRKKNKVVS